MLEQSRKQILNLFNIYSKCLFLNTLVICLQFIQDKHGETMRQCPQCLYLKWLKCDLYADRVDAYVQERSH